MVAVRDEIERLVRRAAISSEGRVSILILAVENFDLGVLSEKKSKAERVRMSRYRKIG
jgi:hypothetical protein